jgi:2-hydroxychromene-2-carboxylate isomerase
MAASNKSFEFFFDIVCPYAYIASTQVEAIAERTGSTLVLKPVLLGGLFKASELKIGANGSFADTLNDTKKRYMKADFARFVKERGVKLKWPETHPRRSVLALRVLLYLTSDESPLKGTEDGTKVSMWRLAKALFEAYWISNLDISLPESLVPILASFGVSNPIDIINAANENETIKASLASRTEEGVRRGLFGVPSFFVSSSPSRLIYGQDNLELLEELLGGQSHLEQIKQKFRLPRSFSPSPSSIQSNLPFTVFPTTFYLDYSSPYTYLAFLQIQSLFGASNLTFEPVLLGAIFKGVGQHNTPMVTMTEARRDWSSKELFLALERINAPFQWASRFPLRTILPLRMTIAAGANTQLGRKLVGSFFNAFWAQDLDPTDSKTCIEIADSCGLDGKALFDSANASETKQALQDKTSLALKHGVFGLPMMAVHRPEGPQWYWGNDRLLWAFQASLSLPQSSSAYAKL